jgi:hypothetical protein
MVTIECRWLSDTTLLRNRYTKSKTSEGYSLQRITFVKLHSTYRIFHLHHFIVPIEADGGTSKYELNTMKLEQYKPWFAVLDGAFHSFNSLGKLTCLEAGDWK